MKLLRFSRFGITRVLAIVADPEGFTVDDTLRKVSVLR
jgi:hypothetical protein